MNKNKCNNSVITIIFTIFRQIALKALSERLKATDSTKHSQLPKSFPQQQQLQHQHHHSPHQQHKHHGHSHSQAAGHSHSHGAGHSHSHGGGHGHSHGPGPVQTPQPDFLKPTSSTGQLPITTSRAEPRMISTMSPIAIPMPAPPPKEGTGLPSSAGAEATLINLDDVPSTSSMA